MTTLWQQYQTLKAQKDRHFYPREGAAELNTNEAALLLSSDDVIYLGTDARSIVLSLHKLGLVQCIVRNDLAVHEKTAVYENVSMTPTTGISLNIGALDLRIFARQWHHVLAVVNHERQPSSYSIQFYDEFGDAIQKVFIEDEANILQWQALVHQFRCTDEPLFESKPKFEAKTFPVLSTEQQEAFHQRWDELKDIHHFGSLLETYGLDRLSAYEQAKPELAIKVTTESIEQALLLARENLTEILIFVGNRGIVQIQTGFVHNIVRAHGWLNILDKKEENFNLHLKDSELDQVWVVRRPTRDGIVTCIEAFDKDRNTVVQFFGRRLEGEQELSSWRAIINQVIESATVLA